MRSKNINTKDIWVSIAIFIIVVALSTDSFINIIYKNRFVQIFTIIVAIVILTVIAIKCFDGGISKKVLKVQVMWIFTSFFVLYNNSDLKNGSGTSYVIYYLLALIILILLKYSEKWIEYFAKFMLITSCVYAFFTILFKLFKPLYYYFINKIYSGAILTQLNQQYNENHMAGIASHYSTNAIYLMLGIGIIVSYYFTDKFKSNKTSRKNIILLIMLLVAIVFTGKRGTVIFGGLSIIVVFLSELSIRRFKKFIKFLMICLSVLFLGVFIIYIIPEIREAILGFLRLDKGKTLNDITSGRIDLYSRALEDFSASPIWGSGWGYYKHKYAYIYSYVGTGFYMDVHNIYIQLLCEIGIVGFIMFVFPMIFTARNTFKLLKKNSIQLIKLSNKHERDLKLSLFLQVFFILYGFTGNPLYDYWVFIIYILGISIFLTVYSSIQLANKSNN